MKRIISFLNKRKKVTLLVVLAGFIAISSTTYNKYFEISKNLEIFANLYREINTRYVDEVDPAALMRTGVDAMLESLDPFTNYISEAEMAGFRLQITGKYGGIGASIRTDKDYVVITEPYEGFPAHKSGILAGDKILTVDGKSAQGKDTKEVSSILKGAPGDAVTISVERPGSSEPLEFTIMREEIKIPNVPYYGMVDDETGYIILTQFSENAGQNVANALKELKEEHDIKNVILDLRGNGGGLLKEAINVSNVFINKGEEIVTTRGKVKDWDRNFKTLNNPIDIDIPVVVLINSSSASASEIVAGVLQDLDRAVLVGQKSYGKGLVQNTRDVGYNSKIKLTTAKYYVASGRCIQSVSYKDGEPVEVPDSLKAVFSTRNGRKVYDGGGIRPDVKIKTDRLGKITQALLRNNLIFDFATNYHQKNPEIQSARTFSFSEKDYTVFKNWLSGKDYSYETDSEKALLVLQKQAKEENYYDAVESSIKDMENKILQEKAGDLEKYKKEITDILEREISGRYYLAKGKIEVGLKNDPEIKEALSLFSNPERYSKILDPK